MQAVITDKWEEQLKRKYWLLGVLCFVILSSFPFVFYYIVAPDLRPSDGLTVFQKVLIIGGFYIGAFVVFHMLTVYYSFLRFELRKVMRISYWPQVTFKNTIPIVTLLLEFLQFGEPFLYRGMS